MARPEWCEALDEEEFPDAPCPACGATVSWKDPVRGVCQARQNRPKPERYIRIVLTDRDTGELI